MSIDAERDTLESMLPPADQEIDSLFDDIRLAEEMLNADDDVASAEQAFDFVNEIDQRWKFMNCTLKVSGRVYYPRVDESDGVDESQVVDDNDYAYLDPASQRDIEQHFYVSRGFYPRKQMIQTGPEAGRERWRIMHLLETTEEVVHADNTVESCKMKCTAMIDEVSIEYPFEASNLAIQRCAYDFPEITENIEYLILNSSNRDEALLSLRKLIIPHITDFEHIDYERIQFYINMLLGLDTRTPSLLTISPNSIVSIQNDSGELVPMKQTKKQKILVTDMEVILMQNFKYSKKSELLEPVAGSLIPALRYTELRSDQALDCTNVWIPIRYIKKCTNLRDAFFRQSKHSDAVYEFVV